MKDLTKIILADLVDLNKPKAVFSAVKKIFYYYYSRKSFKEIDKCYNYIKLLFEGKHLEYQECNTSYHNIRHTMNVFLAAARLIDGYNLKNNILSERMAVNIIKASLFRDVGYIQEKWDNLGTGAKYTMSHTGRSIAFIIKNRGDLALSREDIDVISKLLRCIEIQYKLNKIPFSSDEEKTAGILLGTAEIIGQMSDREYIERLLLLYKELKEADIIEYNTEFDIIKNTLKTYKTIKRRLETSFNKIYTYAGYHFHERYNIDTNLYIDSIEKNIKYLEKIISDRNTNFRKKLRRGNFI